MPTLAFANFSFKSVQPSGDSESNNAIVVQQYIVANSPIPDGTIFTQSFRMKLYWNDSFFWQETHNEKWWCLECTVSLSIQTTSSSFLSVSKLNFVDSSYNLKMQRVIFGRWTRRGL
jgi:hypothetical protein